MKEFKGPLESVYVLEDELIITTSFNDPWNRSLPNEWIYILEKQEIEDIKLEDNTLVLQTKDRKQTRITLFDANKAFLTIGEWIRKR